MNIARCRKPPAEPQETITDILASVSVVAQKRRRTRSYSMSTRDPDAQRVLASEALNDTVRREAGAFRGEAGPAAVAQLRAWRAAKWVRDVAAEAADELAQPERYLLGAGGQVYSPPSPQLLSDKE